MFKTKTTEELLLLKTTCDDAYYNSSEPYMPDETYDLLVEEIWERGIQTNQVGSKLREDIVSVKLPYYLGSMDKFKPDEPSKLDRWLSLNNSDLYVIEAKLDGISCLLEHKKGITKLYTRGDGYDGSDITHLLPYLKFPKLSHDIAIRGELIMDKNKFEEHYSSESSNARNMVSGIVNARSLKVGTDQVEFIAYEILRPTGITPFKQLLDLNTKYGFQVVNFSVTPKAEMKLSNLELEYNKIMSESRFEMDGLIIYTNVKYNLCKKNNPKYAIAFKPGQLVFEAKVVNVQWNVSRHGLLKPRVEIEPVKLKGVTITFATGHNAKFIIDKGIGKDSIILVTRSGDVIPKILDVVKPTEVQLPKDAVWNDTGVELCVTTETSEQDIKSITSFFEKIGAKFVSEQTIRKLYDNGAKSILDIIELKPEDMTKIKGIETKLATRTHTNIHTALQSCSLAKLLGASGIFGFGLGVRKVEALMTSFPDLLETTLSQTEIRSKINDIDGFSSITTEKIISNLNEAKSFIKSLKPYLSLEKVTKKDEVVSTQLKDKTFLFSGFRDKTLEAKIEAKGGKISTSVSSKLKYLVVKDKSDTTSKIQKAKELGVNIISKEELKEILA